MFFKFGLKITLGIGRKRKKQQEETPDDEPYMVIESSGQNEQAPIGFGNEERWEEWEEQRKNDARAKP